MAQSVTKLILKSKLNDSQSILELIARFNNLIKKYHRQSHVEDMENILICHLIHIIKAMPAMTEGQNINYIHTALKNCYINNIQKQIRYNEAHYLTEELSSYEGLEEKTSHFTEMLSYLDLVKRQIITLKYYYGYSDKEIGEKLNMSRQGVNKQKRKAFEIISQQYLINNKEGA